MPSNDFKNLENCVNELKRIYLLDALMANGAHSTDQQELARAFVTFAHAEFEHYLEVAFRSLLDVVLQQAANGKFSVASLSMLTFSDLPSSGGGTSFKGKDARKVATRIFAAGVQYKTLLDDNHGVKEKYLAKIGTPLGFNKDCVDNTWLSDLDAFCSFRGAFAHMSRKEQRASHLSVNPQDIWIKCEKLLWTDAATARAGIVSSFESFDEWIEDQKNAFGTITHTFNMPFFFLMKLWLNDKWRQVSMWIGN
jgi:hypothetical protein